jgi:autotransporter-associated beta strand protein
MHNTRFSPCTPFSYREPGSTRTGGKRRIVAIAAALAVAGTMTLPMLARADTITWSNTGTDWNTPANWSGTVPGSTDEASLPSHAATGLKNPNITNAENPTIADLSIDNSGGGAYALTGNGSLTLNGDGGATNVGLTATGGGSTTLGQSLGTILGADQTWNIDSGTTVTASTGLKSAGNIYNFTKEGDGTLILSGSTFSGGTWSRHGTNTINAGIVKATKASVLGDGITTVNNNAELQISSTYDGGAALPPIVLNDSATLTALPGPTILASLKIGSGATVSIHTSTVGTDIMTMSSYFDGGGAGSSITVSGTGAVNLTGSSGSQSYTGSWIINSGIVRTRFGRNSFGASTNTIYLNGGILATDHGSGVSGDVISQPLVVGGDATVQSDSYYTGGANKQPTGNFTFGTLSIGAHTLTANINPNNGGLTNGNTNLIFGATTLTGNATFQVDNPLYGGGFTTTLDLGTVGETGSSFGFTKTGDGVLRLSGTAHTYSGNTTVSGGVLALKAGGSISNSPTITVDSGAKFDLTALATSFALGSGHTLTGGGQVLLPATGNGHTLTNNGTLRGGLAINGGIGGSGSIDPGNSPGILTANQVDPAAGLSFNFEFTGPAPTFGNPTASGNDLLRLTDPAAPFTAALGAGNTVNVYFDIANLTSGSYLGGFYIDTGGDFVSAIANANLQYYYLDPGGAVTYNGLHYSPLDAANVAVDTLPAPADFGDGIINGQITSFTVAVSPVPEPGSLSLLGLAGLALVLRRRRQEA